MNTLDYIVNKFKLDLNQRNPVEIPNYGRDQFAGLLAEMGFNKGVELGVAHGIYSEVLMQANPELELWGVDMYVPHKGYKDYVKQSTFQQMEQNAHNRLDKYPKYHFIKEWTVEAAKQFEDESLDFVYIDADHKFEAVVADIAAWLPKIRKGGIIAGHDYFRNAGPSHIHVIWAVQGFATSWGIKPLFVIGREAKIPGEIRDNGRSWFWVKQ